MRERDLREDVPCGEDDGSGVIVGHNWPDADWPADFIDSTVKRITQCSNCGWTRAALEVRHAEPAHEVGCRFWNTGCEGDCDCRSQADLDSYLDDRRFRSAEARP